MTHIVRTQFSVVPLWLVGKVSPGAYMLYGFLAGKWGDGSDPDKPVWPGQEKLAAELSMSVRSIRSYLKELEDVGALTIKQRGSKQTNCYYLHADEPAKFAAISESDRQPTSGHDRQPTSGPIEDPNPIDPDPLLRKGTAEKSAGAQIVKTLVGFYVDDYRSVTGKAPPKAWIGACGQQAKRLLASDRSEEEIRVVLRYCVRHAQNPGFLTKLMAEYDLERAGGKVQRLRT